MKQIVLTFTSAALVSMIAAQVNTTAGYFRNFYACTFNNQTYCSDGNCYRSNVPAQNISFVCSTSFNNDAADTRYPVTQGQDFSGSPFVITQLEHYNVINGNNGTMTLKNSTTARWFFQSKAEKSAYVELEYTNPKQVEEKIGKHVRMFVFNNRVGGSYKIFDMTTAKKVLLPQSKDTFTVYLVAQGGDFDI